MIAEGQGQEAPKSDAGDAADAALTEIDEASVDADGRVKPEFGLEPEEQLPDSLPCEQPMAGEKSMTSAAEKPSASGDAPSSADLPCGPATPLLVPLSQPVPDNWVTIEDEFVSVIAVYLSHLGPDLIVDPDIRLDEGIIHLILVHHSATRAQILKLMLQLSDGSVNYHENTSIELVPVTAFRIEPLTEKGCIAVDGEVVDYGPIQGQILPKMATVMGIEKRMERANNPV